MSLHLITDNAGLFLRAARLSAFIFLLSASFSTVIAVLLGGIATSRVGMLRTVARGITEFFRDVPQIVSVFFVFFGAPSFGLQFGPVEATIVSLSLWGGANGAEIVRGGICAVPRHQIESARALGVRSLDIFFRIIVPQAIRPIIPAYAGLCTILLQSTSLGALIGATELLKSAQIVIERAAYFRGGMPGITVYAFILLIYFVAGTAMTRGTRRLEKIFAAPTRRQ
ncbi:amino acid ABC transporter permease [Paraburkholderia phosphatilytica]|uniref:amino acid ABC transporter permease n=1 Tax=Paraburkholderia phosphatilytica TaxID=2282883 RepID=UPI000E4EE232|nr:amino acid ABC transporter permease [Paraburkholderia phosphatilytica]